jgi:hypothetical protein
MTFKFEILIFGQQMKMDINNFEFIIFQLWMNFIQLFIYLIQIINEIHPCKNESLLNMNF